MKGLRQYEVDAARDFFECDEELEAAVDLHFPCCICIHRNTHEREEPCAMCGHAKT